MKSGENTTRSCRRAAATHSFSHSTPCNPAAKAKPTASTPSALDSEDISRGGGAGVRGGRCLSQSPAISAAMERWKTKAFRDHGTPARLARRTTANKRVALPAWFWKRTS